MKRIISGYWLIYMGTPWWPKTTPEKGKGHWWCFMVTPPFVTEWWLGTGWPWWLLWWWLEWWLALLAVVLLLLLLLFCCCAACLWWVFLFFIRLFWNHIFTCLSVKFKFLASSHRFCFDTYELNKNSFSNSNVWNLEYGLRFFLTVTWPVHSRGFVPAPQDPPRPIPTPRVPVEKRDGDDPQITWKN